MPRGRPPIQRTKEEAKIARRAQVRRNVQAHRLRKHSSGRTEKSEITSKEPFKFVFEQWVQHDSPRLLNTDVDALPEQQEDLVKVDRDPQTVDPFGKIKPSSEMNQSSRMYGSFQCLVEIPPEINPAQVSRQQLTSNAATAFLFAQQNPDIASLETGPHWVQMIPELVNRNDVLDCSIQALCLMQIGHIKQERWLLRSSLTFYDRALQALQGALAQPTNSFKPEFFAATMALATYELLQGTGTSKSCGWITILKEPRLTWTPSPSSTFVLSVHQMSFHFLETLCIFDAFGARKPSCFSTSK